MSDLVNWILFALSVEISDLVNPIILALSDCINAEMETKVMVVTFRCEEIANEKYSALISDKVLRTSVHGEKLLELKAKYEKQLTEAPDKPVESLFEASGPDWELIRKLLRHETVTAVAEFSTAFSGFELVKKVKEEAGKVLLHMKDRFSTLFSHDDSLPRVWTGKQDIRKITIEARAASLKPLSVMAALHLDEKTDKIVNLFFSSLVDGSVFAPVSQERSLDPLASNTWEDVFEVLTLAFLQAHKRSNNWLPTPWAILAILGFNESMLLLKNHLYLMALFIIFLLTKAGWTQLDIAGEFRHGAIENKRRRRSDCIDVTSQIRGVLVEWLVEVADECKRIPDTLYLAVDYLDRFLPSSLIIRQRLQLLGVSCMLIASKFEEISPPHVKDVCYITDHTYTEQEVVKIESDILNALKFEVGNPTSKSFFRRFSRTAQGNSNTPYLKLEFLGCYLTELSILDYACVWFLPSMIAASVIFHTNLAIQPNGHPWNSSLQQQSGYRPIQLKECVSIIHDLQLNRRESSLLAVRDKYRATQEIVRTDLKEGKTLSWSVWQKRNSDANDRERKC